MQTIHVELIYALENKQEIITLACRQGDRVGFAIEQSGLLEHYPDLILDDHVGIFSQKVGLDHILDDGDRIEIYRPLNADPKARRRART